MNAKFLRKAWLVISIMASDSGMVLAQGALPKVPVPKDNPQSQAKVELGKKLFFDPRLSMDGSISCASCHNVMSGGEDNRSGSVGVKGQVGGRSAPTVWNAAYYSVLFWDGRAVSLEEQAKGPLLNPIEMGMPTHEAVMTRLGAIDGYAEEFKKVFGSENPMTIDNLAKAIAAYERTLVTYDSAYDRFMKGEKAALGPKAKSGMKIVAELGCHSCHSGPHFSGPTLPAGSGFYQKFPLFAGSSYDKKYSLTTDLGRFTLTNEPGDKNMWRVPTWRNIAVTAPYFHNGKVKTLDEAVRVMAKTQLNKDVTEEQVADIVAFLNSLTGSFGDQKMPRLPPTPGKTLVY